MSDEHNPTDQYDHTPDFAERQAQIVTHWIESGRLDKAIEAGKLALADDPQNSFLHTQMGFAYYNTDQPKLARTHLEASLTIDPEDPYPRSLLAMVNSSGLVSSFSKVEQEALNTLRIDPEDYNAWFILAQNTITYDEAFSINCCDRLIQLRPEEPGPYLNKAIMLTGCEDTNIPQARRMIESALILGPDCDNVHETAAWFFLGDGKDRARGLKHLETALLINPANVEAIAMHNEQKIKRDWIVRTLNLPWKFAQAMFAIVFKWTDFSDVVWFFTWLFVIAVGLLGLWVAAMWIIVCYPIMKLYIWLIRRADELRWSTPSWLAPLFRMPLWTRIIGWTAITSGYWYYMYRLFTDDKLKAGETVYYTVVYGLLFVGIPALLIWYLWDQNKKRKLKKQLPHTLGDQIR